jgi:hypothetical protein
MKDQETGYDDYEDMQEAFETRQAEARESGPMNEAKFGGRARSAPRRSARSGEALMYCSETGYPLYEEPEHEYSEDCDCAECNAPHVNIPEAIKWNSFDMFLKNLTEVELLRVEKAAGDMWTKRVEERYAEAETERWPDSISIADWALTAFTPTKPASIASIGNGICVKTGRRA